MLSQSIVLGIVILLMLVGLVGIVFPVLPGSGLIFVSIAAYGWYEGFQVISVKYLAVMGALTVLAMAMSYISALWGAKLTGAGRAGSWGALLGTIAGVFVFPPLGLLLGPLIGAFIGEYIVKKEAGKAAAAGLGAVVGVFSGMFVHLIIALIMFISFLFRVF